MCYVCVGHVKQIALFIDELPKYVKEIKLKRALEESSCIPRSFQLLIDRMKRFSTINEYFLFLILV